MRGETPSSQMTVDDSEWQIVNEILISSEMLLSLTLNDL